MKILVIGSGGREHALAWKLAQSAGVEVFAAPGNPGIARIGTCVSMAQAEELNPDLTVVGPEVPLVEGIVDRFACARIADRRAGAGGGAARGQQDLRKELFCAKQYPDRRLRYRG